MDSLLGWEDGEETPTRITAALEEKHYGIGLFFNLEATIHLGLWDEVLKICACKDSLKFPKPQFYLQMIDLALQLDAPPAITLRMMKVRSKLSTPSSMNDPKFNNSEFWPACST